MNIWFQINIVFERNHSCYVYAGEQSSGLCLGLRDHFTESTGMIDDVPRVER